MNLDATVVINKSQLAKAAHEEVDAGRVLPIMLARASCEIGGINVTSPSDGTKSAMSKSRRAKRFSAELKS